MRCLFLFGLAVLTNVCAYPWPGLLENDILDEEKINLDSLSPRMFGIPKNSSGDLLKNWDPLTSQSNPEEIGEYEQGDILFPSDGSRNGLRSESARWPNGVVPYVIVGNYPQEYRENIMKAIADYHRLTCIRFVPYKGQANYLEIGSKNTGCWSSVGMIGGRQEVNLQSPGCVTTKGTIIHELLHALGFMHEQSRPERDNFVRINLENVKSTERHNFNKASKDQVNDFGEEYDYGSVMHYSDHAFSTNGQPTIVSKRSGVQLGQRQGFSRRDINKLNKMYKCGNKEFLPWLGQAISSIFG